MSDNIPFRFEPTPEVSYLIDAGLVTSRAEWQTLHDCPTCGARAVRVDVFRDGQLTAETRTCPNQHHWRRARRASSEAT